MIVSDRDLGDGCGMAMVAMVAVAAAMVMTARGDGGCYRTRASMKGLRFNLIFFGEKSRGTPVSASR